VAGSVAGTGAGDREGLDVSVRAVGTSLALLAITAARAEISASHAQVYEGPVAWWNGSVPYVHCYDLQVTVAGDDAWYFAGGVETGVPWINLTGATFFQHPLGGAAQGNPELFSFWQNDVQWDSFYTTALGFPNTLDQGDLPGFAFGPVDTDTQLAADWYWIPDGEYHPGTFTIARFTVIAPPDVDPATTYADIDIVIRSLEAPPIRYVAHVAIPEPGSLAFVPLAGLLLLRGR
jgi:hypothetical protein